MKPSKTKQISKIVVGTVSEYYEISEYNLFSQRRKQEIIKGRHLIMSLLKKYTKLSLEGIGEICRYSDTKKNRDHSSVLYSLKAIQNLKDTDPLFSAELIEIETLVEKRISEIKNTTPRLRSINKRRSLYRKRPKDKRVKSLSRHPLI